MMNVDVFLETERLIIRRFTMDDADLLFELDNDPVVMRYVNGGVSVSREEIVNETLPAFMSYYERFKGYGFWAAIEKQSGRFLGWFHFRPGQGAGPLEPGLSAPSSCLEPGIRDGRLACVDQPRLR